MAQDSTPIEEEIDLSLLDPDELIEFEARLVAEAREKRASEEFSEQDFEELESLKEAIALVREEMAARLAQAKDDEFLNDSSVSAAFASAIEEEEAEEPEEEEEEEVVEPAPAAPAKTKADSDVVISPKGIDSDAPVAASARKPLAKIGPDIRGFNTGQAVESWSEVASAFIAKHPDLRTADTGSSARHLVASLKAEFPEDRILGDNPIVNTRMVEAVTSTDAIIASGGICAPLTPWYQLNTLGDACRPVRDSLPVFRADRGGIRFVTPPKLADLAGSSRRTTAAQDAAGYTNQTPAGTTAPKPCLHVVCGTENTCIVQAVSSCLTFGNFGARTYPEQVEAWLKLARVEFARYQEAELLAAINAGSTQLTDNTQTYGAVYSILEKMSFLTDSFRSRYRICDNVSLRVIAPYWLKTVLLNDLAAQGPGDLGRYSVDEGQLTQWFARRGIRVTWSQEDPDGTSPFGAITAGAIGSFPTTFRWFIFPEGQWVFLDNGVLDLGLVRDSTLNSQNDYQIWMEEFSGVCQVGGLESFAVTSTLCANGAVAPAAAALRTCV